MRQSEVKMSSDSNIFTQAALTRMWLVLLIQVTNLLEVLNRIL